MRSALIKKGMIYSPSHDRRALHVVGELDSRTMVGVKEVLARQSGGQAPPDS